METVKALAIQIVLILLITNLATSSDSFPSTIERCKNDDDECLKNTWNKYIKLSGNPNGIPELAILSTHSYLVRKASISPGSGNLDVMFKMRNATLTGLDETVIDQITGFLKDPKEMTKFEFRGHCPLVGIKGKYNVSGKVLLLPVAGDDEGEVKFYNIKFNMTALTSTKVVDGKEFLVISKVLCSYVTERNFYRFENLLNNKPISDAINQLLNESQHIINDELRKPIGRVIADVVKNILVIPFNKYPYSSFFL